VNRCPITFELCEGIYSPRGLSLLSRGLTELLPLPFSASDLRREAIARAGKMSVQGMQPKLSAIFSPKNKQFELRDNGGTFLIKPQSESYLKLPENEALTLKLAALAGIEIPLCGLLYAQDGSLNFFIKRFDRYGHGKKYAAEDFSQLLGLPRGSKYKSSMEKLVTVIDSHCTFPLIEKKKLFQRLLFSFITGNEDMHLKNFTLLSRKGIISLSPAYDLVNTSLALGKSADELALPLAGKKNRLNRADFFEYFGKNRCGLPEKVLDAEYQNLLKHKVQFINLIRYSFLNENQQEDYIKLLEQRLNRLQE